MGCRFINEHVGIDEFLKQEGKEEGLAEGIEKGIEMGMEKGLEQERENSSRLFVVNLLKDGNFSLEKIASLANVTVDFVNKIKKALKINNWRKQAPAWRPVCQAILSSLE
jgi:flagellar biosynthesis/type III secretory pathway protein FliH